MRRKLLIIWKILRGEGVIYRAHIKGRLDIWPLYGKLSIVESVFGEG